MNTTIPTRANLIVAWCSKCKTHMPVTEFRKNRTCKSGLHDWCKTCASAYHKAWRQRPEVKARRREESRVKPKDRVIRKIPTIDRLMARVKVSASGCWEWQGSLNIGGYGVIGTDEMDGFYTMRLAHRVARTLLRGPIPRALVLDHLCRNRKCVNPDHIEPVTTAVNNRRAARPACSRGHLKSEYRHFSPSGSGWCIACARARYAAAKP